MILLLFLTLVNEQKLIIRVLPKRFSTSGNIKPLLKPYHLGLFGRFVTSWQLQKSTSLLNKIRLFFYL